MGKKFGERPKRVGAHQNHRWRCRNNHLLLTQSSSRCLDRPKATFLTILGGPREGVNRGVNTGKNLQSEAAAFAAHTVGRPHMHRFHRRARFWVRAK